MVYYRKYRPQTIEELDSATLREKLTAVLSKEDISHAFLFTGPKGLGKTSTARILAKAVNCEVKSKVIRSTSSGHESQKSKEQGKSQKLDTNNQELITNNSVEPCNKCSQCESITNGTNVDVLEIDGASNRGIDEMRDLREKIKLLPVSAKVKVYIIDEVHMLTTEAFNALLKTLEEPPAHAMFVLCTTEPQKIPNTILSRCFHIAFKKATKEELLRSFERIVKGEKIEIDKKALELITTLSDGSFRDGAKLLEEISLQVKGKITTEDINRLHHTSDMYSFVILFLLSLHDKDAKKVLELITTLSEEGIEIKLFIEQVLSMLHELLLVRTGVSETSSETHKLDAISLQEIKEMAANLLKSYADVKYAVIPELALELSALDFLTEGAGSFSSAPKPFSEDKKVEKSVTHVGTNNGEFWKAFIEKVKEENHTVAGVLRGCHIGDVVDGTLVIEAAYKFHKDRLEDLKTIELLEKAGKAIHGTEVVVQIVLKS